MNVQFTLSFENLLVRNFLSHKLPVRSLSLQNPAVRLKEQRSERSSEQTAMLNMYRSHGCVADACELFEKMPVKDASAWDSILDAYASTDHQEASSIHCIHQDLETGKRVIKLVSSRANYRGEWSFGCSVTCMLHAVSGKKQRNGERCGKQRHC
ncbi:hypothetical protein NC651_038042 [Populus alba x Populus x berolinensis]|nr:hypothetical protein NC651_038042 [Populus alba x Populus x berolinensis]